MDITSANELVIEAQIIEALRTVFDPEIPVNIYELGLIYEIKVDPSNVGRRRHPNDPHLPQLSSGRDAPRGGAGEGEGGSGGHGCQGRGRLRSPLGPLQDVRSGQT